MKSKNEFVLGRAKYLYNQYPFGYFSYNLKRSLFSPLIQEILPLVKQDEKLFDIGSGSGFWVDIYLKAGISQEQIHCLDLALGNITPLKNKVGIAIVGNVLCLPFKDNVSDWTFSEGVIHHTDNPYQAFMELVRITKPGGGHIHQCL